MNPPFRSAALFAVLAAILPPSAHAHAIHPWMAAAALSPLLAIALAVALGFLARSAVKGVMHAALILLWVALFWLASNLVTSDIVIWTPLVIYLGHVLVLLGLVIRHATARLRGKATDA